MGKPETRAAGWIVFLLFPACLTAGTIYSVVDLGKLAGGSATSASGISSNGSVTGSGDTASAFSTPFLWSSAAGLTTVTLDSSLAFGMGVNASGAVVGYQFGSDFSLRGFLNDGSGTILIPLLGGANNTATAINNAGTVVGYSVTTDGKEIAFSYVAGASTPLGVLPGGANSRANAINSFGTIVGQADDSSGLFHAVLLSGGAWTDLGVPPGYESGAAMAISDLGQVAGTFDDGVGGSMAFLWTPSGQTVVLLGALAPGGNSRASGVNSSGLVVGTSGDTAFLYDAAGMHDLNTLLAPTSSAWQLSETAAINDLGQIVGTGYLQGQQHALLLNPEQTVPEPATLPLSCGVLLLLAVMNRRRFRKEEV